MCISHTNSCTICSRHRCLAVCLKWCSYQDEFLIPFVSLRIHSKSTLIMGDASKIKYPTSLTAGNIRTLQSQLLYTYTRVMSQVLGLFAVHFPNTFFKLYGLVIHFRLMFKNWVSKNAYCCDCIYLELEHFSVEQSFVCCWSIKYMRWPLCKWMRHLNWTKL